MYQVLQVARVVVSVRESTQIVEELLRAGQPVGLDGEGVNLGPKGQLTLLQVRVITIKMEMMRKIVMIIVIKVLMTIAQVSTASGQVIIFDVQTTPAIMSQGGLQRLLQAEHIIKVRDNFCISFNTLLMTYILLSDAF